MKTLLLVLALLTSTPLGFVRAQSLPRDPEVAAALRRIDADRIERDIRKLASFGTRHALSSQDDPVRGVGAAGAWIKSELEKAAALSEGRMAVSFDPFDPRDFAGRDRERVDGMGVHEIRNVIAKLEGSEPGRVIIVSGHYDSRAGQRWDVTSDAPGANDDGSGTAVVMELARALAPIKTRASIWFACVTAEEEGLWGSRHLAKFCDEEGITVEAMITNDIVGGAKDKNGFSEDHVLRIFSEGRPHARPDSHPRRKRQARWPSESDSPSRELARHTARMMELYTPDFRPRLIFRLDRYLRGGDHRPFTLLGYPGIRLTEPKENYRHQHQDVRREKDIQYGDLPQYVDFAYVARVARANAASILGAARAPGPPRGVRLLAALTNESTLFWKSTDDPSVKGYRLLMRRTSEPRWSRRKDLALVDEVTVPESKDDWLFALQAVDADGRASLPTFALPGRRRR